MPSSLALLASDSYWEQDADYRYTTFVVPPQSTLDLHASRVVGRTRWELAGVEPLNFTWERHRADLAARRAFKDLQFLVACGPAGSQACMSSTGEPRFDSEGLFLGYHGMARDITAEWQEKRKLEDAERMLHFAARIARFGGWSLDLPSMRLTWSDAVCDIHEVPHGFNCTVAEAVDFYAPEYREAVAQQVERCARQGTPFDFEAQIVTSRGRRVWVRGMGEARRDSGGRITGVQGAFQDIDALKAIADERQKLAEKLTTTLDSLTDGVFAVDHAWRLIYANPEAGRIARTEPSAAMGRTLWEVFPLLLGTPFEAEYRRAMQERVPVEFVAFYPPLAIWVRVRAWPTPEGLAACFVDITAQKNAEEELRRLNVELEARVRQRTAALEHATRELETLTYAIAHDVRAPLVSMNSFAQAIERTDGAALSERGRHYLERIRAGAAAMNAMTEGLLQLGRIARTQPRLEPVDLTRLASEIWETIAAQNPARAVRFDVAAKLHALGASAQLALVLQNLLNNAWKFTSGCTAAQVEIGGLPSHGCQRVFFVRDNGAGFDPAYADKLFQPFQRLHGSDEFPGTGLGLATVRKVVEVHGGRVWAESAPGQGAAFYFSLPQHPRTADLHAGAEEASQA